jgi:hypothetical protein
MKTEKFAGTIETAYGKPVSPALKYAGEVETYESIDEVKAKGEFPKDSEILSYVNARAKANKRAEVMNATLKAAGIEKPGLTDPEVQFKEMVKILQATGKSEADARQSANAILGTSY